jgi:multicomponent Na+:H+ antiporter subunit G
MTLHELVSCGLTFCGASFFLAATVGLLRFPDVYTRLHALTKADNLGLGLIVMGLLLRADSWFLGAKLLLIWLLAMFASTTACHLVARAALRAGIPPWRRS